MKLEGEQRDSGIALIGDVPWGTHFCQFYQTKKDLLEIFVPYFKAGLKNNELCVWLTSRALGAEDAKKALKKLVPHYEKYAKNGQILFVPSSRCHAKKNEKPGNLIISLIDTAVSSGFEGIRLACTAFLSKEGGKPLTCFEADALSKYNALAVFAYPRDKFDAIGLMEVVKSHRLALVKNAGKWEVLESSAFSPHKGYFAVTFGNITERKRAEAERERLLREAHEAERDFARAQEIGGIGNWRLNLQRNELVWSDENHRIFGVPKGTPLTYETFLSIVHPDDRSYVDRQWKAGMAGKPYDVEHRIIVDGKVKWVCEKAFLEFDAQGALLSGFGITHDITQRKFAEEALLRSNQRLDLLSYASGKLLFSRKPQQIIEQICRRVLSVLDCHVFFNYMVDEEKGRLRLNAYAGISEETAREIEWLDYGTAVCGCAARDGVQIICENIPETPDPGTDLVRSFGIKAYVCYPLFSHGKVIGTLSFGTTLRTKFTEDELALMKSVSAHVSIAIERDRSLHELEARVRERTATLEETMKELKLEIAERKHAEENMLLFRDLINQSNDIIHIVDPETGAFLDVNEKTYSSLGYSVEEMLGMKVYDIAFDITDLQAWRKAVEAIRNNEFYIIESRVRRKDGAYLPVEVNATNVTHGNKEYIVAVLRDIAERKEIENRIIASNTLLRLIGTTISRKDYLDEAVKLIQEWSGCRCVGIRVLNEKGNIPYESYVGFSREFWEKENYLSVKTDQCACIRVITEKPEPQDAPYISPYGSFYCNNSVELLNSLREEEKRRFRGVCIQNGFLSIAVIPIRYQDNVLGAFHLADEKEGMVSGKSVEFIEGIAPVIGEVINRFNIEEDRTRLMAAAESALDAIILTDTSWKIQYMNPAAEHLTGYSREDAVGQDLHIFDSGSNDEVIYQAAREAVNQGQSWNGLLIRKRKDGTPYHEDCTIAPVKDTAGNISNYLSVRRDVTDNLRLESIAEAVNTMNNIGYVFSGIRHEIGNPVNSIKMTLNVLKRNLDKYEKANIIEYLDRALSESSRIEYLLKSLKNFNMFESPEMEDVEINKFMDNFYVLVSGDSAKKGIEVTITVSEDASFFYADPRALQQVLLNIFANAMDACEGRESPAIDISVSKIPDMVFVRIIDNGRGMTDEEQKNLFRPFHTTKRHGTGLGLVICKKMLSKMNCFIEVQSMKGTGTTVDILIPEEKSG